MKAILELDELPKSCMYCPIAAHFQESGNAPEYYWCPPIMDMDGDISGYSQKRHPLCPLTAVS